jgi:GDP-L-fucose synthase
MNKKILITGGGGFIARSLYEQLSSVYDIVLCTRKELELLESSQVSDYLKSNKFDVVIHTATYAVPPKYSIKDPLKILENNLRMYFNLARCKDYFGKMIYFGSGAEFDREHWVPKMRENYFDRYVPKDQYGLSKYVMSKYTQTTPNIYNLRLFGVFGKYDDWRYRFIPNACRNAVLGLPIAIYNASGSFDYLYIDDLIKVVKWFIDNKPANNIYNVCTGKAYDLKTLAEKIIAVSSKKLDIIIKEDALAKEYNGDYSLLLSLGKEYSGDNSLLLSELTGFKFTPIERAIKYLYDWYDSNRQIIEEEKP